MQVTKRTKLMVGALAVVGASGFAGLASSAFTGTGVTNSAGATQFVGGTISQSVTGATLSDIAYAFTDDTNTAINQVILTFADANTDGMTPTITFTSSGSPVAFTCTAIESSGHTSTCTPTDTNTSQAGATGISVTVS